MEAQPTLGVQVRVLPGPFDERQPMTLNDYSKGYAMKVWELIALLSKEAAGDDVFCSREAGTHIFEVKRNDGQGIDDAVLLVGDGTNPDDSDVSL